jgi:hypothetical protein
MIFFQISDSKYLIHLKRKVSWNEFRKKAKVIPETYAETFARRIYSSAFEHSTDLADEFRRYYQNEYKSFNDFLFWRYGVSEEIINKIAGAPKGYLTIFNYDWRINDDETLNRSIEQLFSEMEVKI